MQSKSYHFPKKYASRQSGSNTARDLPSLLSFVTPQGIGSCLIHLLYEFFTRSVCAKKTIYYCLDPTYVVLTATMCAHLILEKMFLRYLIENGEKLNTYHFLLYRTVQLQSLICLSNFLGADSCLKSSEVLSVAMHQH